MNKDTIIELLNRVANRDMDVASAFERLRDLPFESLPFATLDHHRSIRLGFPEVVFGEGKTLDQIKKITANLAEKNPNVLVTRLEQSVGEDLVQFIPGAEYDPLAGVFWLHRDKKIVGEGAIVVVTAGSSDLPVAREAAITARVMGNVVTEIADVGVSGIHRVFAVRKQLEEAHVLIVVAGMEGALPSVIGGLVPRPIIAVPTSVGYGAAFGGLTALLGMLNSCAAGVTVVNIDNGFGAAYAASLINRCRKQL